MDKSLHAEIVDCIVELESIVSALYEVSDSIKGCISGMNTNVYTVGLERAAEKYSRAAEKLKNIK